MGTDELNAGGAPNDGRVSHPEGSRDTRSRFMLWKLEIGTTFITRHKIDTNVSNFGTASPKLHTGKLLKSFMISVILLKCTNKVIFISVSFI